MHLMLAAKINVAPSAYFYSIRRLGLGLGRRGLVDGDTVDVFRPTEECDAPGLAETVDGDETNLTPPTYVGGVTVTVSGTDRHVPVDGTSLKPDRNTRGNA